MDERPAAPQLNARPPGPRPPHSRLRAWLAVGFTTVILLSGAAWALAPRGHTSHPENAFRFEQVFLSTVNETGFADVQVDAWFTNQEGAVLHKVRMVAIAVETGRSLAAARDDVVVGELSGRHTDERTFHLRLNVSQSYQVEILVLVDGLLVARGQGSLGPSYIEEGDFDTSPQLTIHDAFQFNYGQ